MHSWYHPPVLGLSVFASIGYKSVELRQMEAELGKHTERVAGLSYDVQRIPTSYESTTTTHQKEVLKLQSRNSDNARCPYRLRNIRW